MTIKTAKTVNASSTAFVWDEDTTAKATSQYLEMLNENGAEHANENLKEIAKTIGAKSANAVRSKLVSAKVYVKADAPRKVGGGTSVRKIHYVRALVKAAQEKGLDIDDDAFDSLESSKVSALKALAALAGVTVEAE